MWVIYPQEKVVEIWRSAGDDGLYKRTLHKTDMLTGDDVLPQFTMPVTELFPKQN